MRLLLERSMPHNLTTFGTLFVDDAYYCRTLEDMLREVRGRPAAEWKIKHETAIGAGDYELYLVDSPAHGPDTLRLRNVDGFDCIDIHSGVSKESTDGCIIVGSVIHPFNLPPTISGGLNAGVLAGLKSRVVPVLKAGEKVSITIANPQGWLS